MNISHNWLCQYLNTGLSPQKIADLLTSCGLEVEGIEIFESVKGGLKGLVVGEVLEAERHPNADRLSVCKVNTGDGQVSQIVCGAPNVAAGQKVIVALPGAILYPTSGEPFEIKKSKIRGEASEGMICAEDEIGMGESHEGILILDPSAVPGTPVADYFRMETDHIMSIGLTPNRPDAASHIGVARDLAAVLNTRGLSDQFQQVAWPDVSGLRIPNQEPVINVKVEDKACIRYSGLHISGVKTAPSPQWLQDRLLSVGLKPINNIVDITNFVLYEMGQPLHAFDADQIAGKEVIVKRLAPGTVFRTLDEVDRELKGHELMICDSKGGMCIAGVFGGLHSGVSSATTSVFLESATFDPVSVRKTSRTHGLKTDASFRFERGTDPDLTVTALKRAAALICEIAGGSITSRIIDVYPVPVEAFEVPYSLDEFSSLTGVTLDAPTIEKLFASLDIRFVASGNGKWLLHVPPYRVDVKRAADVSEEALRIYGYDRIPLPEKMNAPLPPGQLVALEQVRNKVAAFLVSEGFSETMSNSLTRASLLELYPEQPVAARIRNPLSQELDIMRPHMLFPLLDLTSYNVNRKNSNLRVFEFGKTYVAEPEKYMETNRLAILLNGTRQPEHWQVKDEPWTIFFLKSLLTGILDSASADPQRYKWETSDSDPFIEMQVSVMARKRPIAVAGKVKRTILKHFGLSGEVWYADIDLDVLETILRINAPVIAEPPRFPEVRRDLSMLLDKNVAYSGIESLALETERKLLKRVNLFDVYEGDKIESGKKSYALSFFLRDDEKTLTDKEIDKVMQRLMDSFEKKLGAVIRKA